MANDSSGPTALGQLISDVQAANKWSYAEIAHNAEASGRRLSKSRVESLRNAALPSISIKAIEALAAGLKVAPHLVARAAVESMGYAVVAASPDPADALAQDPALSEPMRRVLMAALTAAHDEFRAEGRPTSGRGKRRGPTAGENVFQREAADDEAHTGP
jgi:hypothetical protein